MFGALRRLLMSGDVRGLLEGSRRAFRELGVAGPTDRSRARALEDLNARGGIAGPRVSQGQRGDFTNEAFMSDPDFAFNQRYVDPFGGNEREFYGVLPDGRRMTLNPRTGARSTSAPWQESMIETPYEGMRVLPEGGRYDAMYSEYSPINNFGEELAGSAPGPWLGRGEGTNWGQLPWNGMDGSDGVYFGQFPGTRPLGGPLPWPDRPAFPWQMFAHTGRPTPTRPGAYGTRPIPFEEVMRAQGSLMGDPRFGPYVSY